MHPAKTFILYLLTSLSKAESTDEAIISALDGLDLFPGEATPKVLSEMREMATPPSPMDLSKIKRPDVIRFLRELRVLDLHRMTPACSRATKLLKTPRARDVVEQLLLAHTPMPALLKVLERRGCPGWTAEDVDTFRHCFFEPSAWSKDQWVAAVRKRVTGKSLRTALTGHPEVTLWRMGESIVVDSRNALEEALRQSYLRLLEIKDRPTDGSTAKIMLMCIDGIDRAQKALRENSLVAADMLKKLEKFQSAQRAFTVQPVQSLESAAEAREREEAPRVDSELERGLLQ